MTSLVMLAFAIVIGMVFSVTLRTFFFPEPKVANLGDVLPLVAIIQDKVILGKRGSCSAIIKINGIDSGSKSAGEIEALLTTKQHWLDKMAEQGANFKIITLRREYKHKVDSGDVPDLLRDIHEKWMENFEKTYSNTHYIVLTVYPNQRKDVFSFFKKELPEVNTGLLKEQVALTLDGLNSYKPEVMHNDGEWSEIMAFLNELATAKKQSIRPKKYDINDALSHRMTFLKNSEIIKYDETQFAKIISLSKWDKVVSSEMLKEIQALSGKLEILQIFKGYGKIKSLMKLNYQRKQKQLPFQNTYIEDEYRLAVEEVEAGRSSLYDYQLSVIVFAEDLKQLEALESQVKRIMMGYGITPATERLAKEEVYKSQFPGMDKMIRPTHPLSCNLSYLFNFDSEPSGLEKCDWGEGPLRPFKTVSGSAYSLQFHVVEDKESVGHSLVVAPTRGGKTTLFQHLIGGALRHPNLRAFIFDRLNGTRIFTESIGGNYVDLSDNEIPLNPFVCKDSIPNRQFLKNFLLMLAKCNDDESANDAALAVEQILTVPVEERILKHCYANIAKKGSLFAMGLRKWVLDDTLSPWFNGSKIGQNGKISAFDALDLSSNRLTAFEMTRIQQTPETAAAVTTYLMHRIREIGRGAFPHLIFIDETAPMLEDATFSKSVDVLLREHAKLRGAVSLCFQDTTAINSVILNQCQTWFLFPNHAANKEQYKMFDLTDFEWDYIKGFNRISKELKRSVLLKKPQESVILNIDLSSLGNLLQLYRSGSEPVKIVRELQKQWGVNQWVDKYLSL
ncbi:MAG TPA: hypothetical protein PLV31_06390 [Gammaproteobacteria bacterium]|nr:hypothetical protein [Gammaproteobacteria bacterium]HRA43284.1 hypothetical protein [Gammaproteobacteria bacterium]